MRLVTWVWAWLVGYYIDECPVCGRFAAILGDGRVVAWCSQRKHAEVEKCAEAEK